MSRAHHADLKIMIFGGGSAPWYVAVALLAFYLAIFGSIVVVGFNILLNLYRLTVAEHRTQSTYRKLAFFCGLPIAVAMIMVVANWGKLEGANTLRAYRSTSVLAEQHFGAEVVTNHDCSGSSVQIERSADQNLVRIKSGATVEWHEFVALEAKRLEEHGWAVERRVSTPSYDERARLGFQAQHGDDLVTLYTFTGNFGFDSAACLADAVSREAARNGQIREARPDAEWTALPVTEIAVATYPEVVGLDARRAAWTGGVGGGAVKNYQLLSGYLGGSSRWHGDTVSFGVGHPEHCASHTMIRRNFDRPQGQTETESLEFVVGALEADNWLVSRQVHERGYFEPKALAVRDDVALIVTAGPSGSQAIWLPSECIDWSNRTLPDYVEVRAFDT